MEIQEATLSITSIMLPQGNVFTPVCHSVHRGAVCLSAGWDTHIPWADPPRADTPLGRHPLGRHPLGRHPLGRHPRADTPLGTPPSQTPPGQILPSRRYASYWNAFLLNLCFTGRSYEIPESIL